MWTAGGASGPNGHGGNGADGGHGGNGHGAEGGPELGRTLAVLRRHGAELFRQQYGGRPRILEIEVTRSCNAQCAWCDGWRAPGSEPELADFSALVRRIRPLDVALVGGEPLLRPDLERLAASLRFSTEVGAISLLTNGIALTLDRARRLRAAGVDKLIVAVEGIGEENDRARRVPGLWARIDGLLPGLREVGFRSVQLQLNVTARNADHLERAAIHARERGVRIAFALDTAGRDEARRWLPDEESLRRLEAAVGRVIELAERWSHVVTSADYLRGIVEHLAGRRPGGADCASGTAFLYAGADGWIRPCPAQPPLGHWTAFPFPPRRRSCEGCWSRLRGETGARVGVGRLVELYRSVRAGDP